MNRSRYITPIVAIFIAACGSPKTDTSTAGSAGGPQAPAPVQPDEWAKEDVSTAMDGRVVNVSKDFRFPKNSALIRAKLTCIVSTKALLVSLESYTLAPDGQATPAEFTRKVVGSNVVPNGRVKFSGIDPQELYRSLSFDQGYNNVIAGSLGSNLSILGFGHLEHQDIHGSGNLLKAILPMVLEVSSAQGTFEVTVPSDSRNIDALAEACLEDKRAPAIRAATEAAEKAREAMERTAAGASVAANYKSTAAYTKVDSELAICQDQVAHNSPTVASCSNKKAAYDAYMSQATAEAAQAESVAKKAKQDYDDAMAALEDARGGKDAPSAGAAMTAGANSAPDAQLDTAGRGGPATATDPTQSGQTPTSAPSISAPTQVSDSGQSTATSVARPSFNCAQAGTNVEKLICTTPELAAADRDMADAYKKAYAIAGSNAPSLKQGQREFMTKRNQCDSIACIAEAYKAREAAIAKLGT